MVILALLFVVAAVVAVVVMLERQDHDRVFALSRAESHCNRLVFDRADRQAYCAEWAAALAPQLAEVQECVRLTDNSDLAFATCLEGYGISAPSANP